MRPAIVTFFVFAIGLGVFSWWGMFTVEGQRRYDEMDGMYPFFAGCGALGCIVIALGLLAVRRFRSRPD